MMRNVFQELFLMAQGPYDSQSLSYEFMRYDAGQIIRFNYTLSRHDLGEVYNASVNNWSALAFSQTNYAWNEFENWFTRIQSMKCCIITLIRKIYASDDRISKPTI